MSDRAMSRPLGLVAYGLVALAIVFEVVVVWLMLHPQVPADYRAYYIDQSTTCLNQPVSGDYALGTTVSFRNDGAALAKPLRVCGWEGPVGDGTHAVGTSARLRFAVADTTQAPLALTLELVAVAREGHPSQRVLVSVNGVETGTITVLPDVPQQAVLDIAAATLAANPGVVDVVLQFPDGIKMSPNDSNTRMRSIKLLSANLGPANP